MANPRAGPVIKGTSGLRKLRWSTAKSGKGKRGGIRVIYYYVTQERAFLMLLAYRKPDQEELSEAQRKALVKLVTMLRTP